MADLDFGAQRLRANLRAKMFGIESGPVRIGRYAVLRMLGRGATGAVYAAYDEERDRRVAIKLAARPGEGWQDAQILARLRHEHLVDAFEVGTFDGRVYLVMEYIRGHTLAGWLTQRRSPEEIVGKYLQAGRGLAAAHRAGVVHRDFKPANLLLGHDGRVRVVDFGLARSAVEGTPPFKAPEQLQKGPVDPRTDQFSFCLAIFDALFGLPGHAGRRSRQVLLGVLDGVRALAPRRTAVPRRITAALERGLSRDPTARFDSMESLLGELEPERGLLGIIAVGARLVR